MLIECHVLVQPALGLYGWNSMLLDAQRIILSTQAFQLALWNDACSPPPAHVLGALLTSPQPTGGGGGSTGACCGRRGRKAHCPSWSSLTELLLIGIVK